MSLIVINFTFSAGAVIIASQHNANFSTIYSDYNGNITNDNISGSASIIYSKLSLTGSIVNADINASAAIAYSKLNLTGSIVNADINASAAIVDTKLAQITTASKVSGTAITGLASLPSGAGIIPTANLPTLGAVTFISSTAVSAATTSGSISVTATNNYMVIVVAKDVSAGSNTLGIRVNGDTGGNYFSGYSGRGSSAAIGASNSSATSIIPGTAITGSQGFNMTFYIIQDLSTANSISINGMLFGPGGMTTGGAGTVSTFGGQWAGAAAPTAFSVIGSGNYTGTVYLYQIKIS